MLKRLILSGITVTALLGISGCGMIATPIDLIKPPVSQGNLHNDTFSHSLRNLLPEGARLLTSTHGEGTSGISFGDVDGDGISEALVIYDVGVINERTLKAVLLKQQNEKWRIVWDTKGFGYGLDYVGLSDLNKDGCAEIILGWTMGAGGNGLEIYEWINNGVELKVKKGYQGHLDFDDLPSNHNST
ncbi:hypothetical protein E0485_00705 [Paenibacillus albiflavus]|uniref:VCBS repeat-containing protein n=1 Tax=Paenibacillus albiflavus TaxID=2545760 RepID=A0A4R4ER14_9BACL|nr:hypothetical protein [Paenibacillus albiflavus]TCZ80848.1 hypothetical protein E0485_00705 [Paenibacillus albiflavus]